MDVQNVGFGALWNLLSLSKNRNWSASTRKLHGESLRQRSWKTPVISKGTGYEAAFE